MRVIVCGGRHYGSRPAVWNALDRLEREHGAIVVIQGGALGADHSARLWCAERKRPCVTHEAEWTKHGPSAGPRRNQDMLDVQRPDLVLAFPGGRGTADMVRRAQKASVPVIKIEN